MTLWEWVLGVIYEEGSVNRSQPKTVTPEQKEKILAAREAKRQLLKKERALMRQLESQQGVRGTAAVKDRKVKRQAAFASGGGPVNKEAKLGAREDKKREELKVRCKEVMADSDCFVGFTNPMQKNKKQLVRHLHQQVLCSGQWIHGARGTVGERKGAAGLCVLVWRRP